MSNDAVAAGEFATRADAGANAMIATANATPARKTAFVFPLLGRGNAGSEFLGSGIPYPTKTSPIHRSTDVPRRRSTPAAVADLESRSRTMATTTPGSATTRPLNERPSAYEAGDTLEATNMSWKRNHCLLK